MDLINWSLNAIDTIFSTRSTGSGEPNCPDGTYPAGYTMDAWDRWRVVCLAALSVEDIEDIYLFGTMITGLLLIGLGFALGYRRIKETGTAVQSLTRLPVKEKLTETRTDNKSSRGIGMRLLALRLNKHNLIFSGSLYQHWPWPVGKSTLRSTAGRRSLRSSPIPQTPADYTYTHIHTY